MDAALEAFGRLVDYEVGEVTAAATFYMAELYFDFSRALNESERPTDLDPAELQDYEAALEEEAFPFEEKAIEVHEKNLELMAAGVYNPWIEKSLARLAVLMPGRYAKAEASSGFIASIDTYAYQAPSAPGSRAGRAPRSSTSLRRPSAAEASPAEPIRRRARVVGRTAERPDFADEIGAGEPAAPDSEARGRRKPTRRRRRAAWRACRAEPAGEAAVGVSDANPR